MRSSRSTESRIERCALRCSAGWAAGFGDGCGDGGRALGERADQLFVVFAGQRFAVSSA
jgi:hypothetical protein